MQLYLTESTNPYRNLAIEEYLLRQAEGDFFLLWRNEPTVVIGKNQNYYSEVCEEEVLLRKIHVARRITGGGAVYHDFGNINYSFITSRDRARVLDFAFFTQPIIEALASLGIRTSLSGRNDLLICADGDKQYKISGNAQTATEQRILHHGTLLFDSQLDVLGSVLKPDEDKYKSKGIKSVRSRVSNLRSCLPESQDMNVELFFEKMCLFAEKKWKTTFVPFTEECAKVSEYERRNASEAYIKGRKQIYEHEKKGIFSGERATILWSVENGLISAFRMEGDFFGTIPTDDFEKRILHIPFTKDGMHQFLSFFPVSQVIEGWTNDELIALLFDE